MHEHNFVEHCGIYVFARTAIAWIPAVQVEKVGTFTTREEMPKMLRCTSCGEQGYEVPA